MINRDMVTLQGGKLDGNETENRRSLCELTLTENGSIELLKHVVSNGTENEVRII